jgi:hypothetical protein
LSTFFAGSVQNFNDVFKKLMNSQGNSGWSAENNLSSLDLSFWEGYWPLFTNFSTRRFDSHSSVYFKPYCSIWP